MQLELDSFKVDTRPSKEVVVDSLIRDISVEACIYDLIDNSIDAARDTLYRLDSELSKDLSPSSYEGYRIEISSSGEDFTIIDNCGGITKADLEKSVLRFGQRSTHNSGIGVFGVGLNRALFKLGKFIELNSDTGREHCYLELDTVEYIRSDDWFLPALQSRSVGVIGTSLKISRISSETSRKFSDTDWCRDFIVEAGRRYGKFIDKGLSLRINDVDVSSELIRIRTGSPYDTDRKFFKIHDHDLADIAVHIEAGQHEKHRFSVEQDSKGNNSRELTSQYGWTIFCNDRAVIISDQTWKTGWAGKFHSQFYGFVGIVNFYCKSPERLPWSTTKTDVDLNSTAYQTALDEMKKFTSNWRAFSERMKDLNAVGGKLPQVPQPQVVKPQEPFAKPKPKPKPAGPVNPGATKVIKKPTKKIDHNTFETILPDDIDELLCNDKHLALVHEAKMLNLNRTGYSGLLLIRTLFEVSAVWFLIRKNSYGPLKQQIVNKRNAERARQSRSPLTKVEETNASPSLDEVIAYFETDDSVWDDANRKSIKISLKKFAQHKEKLNSAVHSHFQPISKLEAFQIRDEVLPILRYMITTE